MRSTLTPYFWAMLWRVSPLVTLWYCRFSLAGALAGLLLSLVTCGAASPCTCEGV